MYWASIGNCLLALGANVPGLFGKPGATFARALRILQGRGVRIVSVSGLYRTPPFGPAGQPAYLNAVVGANTALGPEALLKVLKEIERQAGRRGGRRWGPRPLDIDVVDYKQRIAALPGRSIGMQQMKLYLPHYGVASRAFVLVPLLEIAPNWVHPVTHRTGRALARRLSADAAQVVKIRGSDWFADDMGNARSE